MAGAHLGHNCAIGNNVIIANNCLLGGYVAVDDGAFLGGGCVFHQFMRVGRLAITQGTSGFGKDIPPFVAAAGVNKVVGLNVVGLRRAGFSAEERAEIKAAFRLLYESGLNVSQALAQARAQKWGEARAGVFRFRRQREAPRNLRTAAGARHKRRGEALGSGVASGTDGLFNFDAELRDEFLRGVVRLGKINQPAHEFLETGLHLPGLIDHPHLLFL